MVDHPVPSTRSAEVGGMPHPLHRVIGFEIVAPFTLAVEFDDVTRQVVDLRPVLAGQIFGPLRDPEFFARVRLDPESRTLVWPNGADLDPAILHDWPERSEAMIELARGWDEA